jgi:hypothetical protein
MRLRIPILIFGVLLLVVAAVIAAVPFAIPEPTNCPGSREAGTIDPSCGMGQSVHHFGIAAVVGGAGLVVVFLGML